MNTRAEPDTDSHPEVYEPPMLEEIGGFAALTRADNVGRHAEGSGYYIE